MSQNRLRRLVALPCCFAAGFAAFLPATASAQLEDAAVEQQTYRCAIVVKNRGIDVPEGTVESLEDQLAALLADEGFELIRREDVLNAVSSLADSGPNVGDDELLGQELDTMLSNNTSALRLAQNLNADYLMTAAMSSFDVSATEFSGYGVDRKITEYTLRTSLAIVGRASGATKTGSVITATIKRPSSGNLRITGDVMDKLLADTAKQAAVALSAKADKGRVGSPEELAGPEPFFINATMGDLSFPEVVKNDDGEYEVTANNYKLQAFGVVVEMDGIVVGSTPGPFEVSPGLHKVRLRRPGFEDWEGNVNVREGQPLTISMVMTPDFRQQFMDQADFFAGLKRGEKLTDAQVEVMKGYADFLKNSEVKIGVDKINVVNRSRFSGMADLFGDVNYFDWLDTQSPTTAPGMGSDDLSGE